MKFIITSFMHVTISSITVVTVVSLGYWKRREEGGGGWGSERVFQVVYCKALCANSLPLCLFKV